jgi:hypothetical protein
MLQPLVMLAAGVGLIAQREKVAQGVAWSARGARQALGALHNGVRRRGARDKGLPAPKGLPPLSAPSDVEPQRPRLSSSGARNAATAGARPKPTRLPGAPISICAAAGTQAPPLAALAPEGGAAPRADDSPASGPTRPSEASTDAAGTSPRAAAGHPLSAPAPPAVDASSEVRAGLQGCARRGRGCGATLLRRRAAVPWIGRAAAPGSCGRMRSAARGAGADAAGSPPFQPIPWEAGGELGRGQLLAGRQRATVRGHARRRGRGAGRRPLRHRRRGGSGRRKRRQGGPLRCGWAARTGKEGRRGDVSDG